MSMSINTNSASLTAQINASKSQSALQTAISRLSSGLRINSARDDAAGLAIADRFTSQINGLDQAARNANDGISLAQTADGALASISSNLQRIRELSVQSANATNSASDRASLQLEVTQLTQEINRVATQTSFNGTNLLDGTFSNKVFQVGANANETITLAGISSARTSDLGASYKATKASSGGTTTALAAGDLVLNGVSVQASVKGALAGQAADSAYSIAQAINSSQGAVVATAGATVKAYAAPAFTTDIAANATQINGVNVGAVAHAASAVLQGAAWASAINAVSGASGVSATADASTGALTLTAADGRNIAVTGDVSMNGLTAATTHGDITLQTNSAASAQANIVISGANVAYAGFTASTTASALTGTAIANIDISSVAGANTALASVDSALGAIDSARASLGAIQNRFSSTVANLQSTSSNLSDSRSRIQDADFAQETANLSRAQVLQQAGTAMIAQANQLPQQVLQLLR